MRAGKDIMLKDLKEDFQIPTMLINVLETVRVTSLFDLCRMTKEETLHLRLVNSKGIELLEKVLVSHGLEFGMYSFQRTFNEEIMFLGSYTRLLKRFLPEKKYLRIQIIMVNVPYVPLEDMGFNVGLYSILKGEEINSLVELACLPKGHLGGLTGITELRMKEIEKVLSAHGLVIDMLSMKEKAFDKLKKENDWS